MAPNIIVLLIFVLIFRLSPAPLAISSFTLLHTLSHSNPLEPMSELSRRQVEICSGLVAGFSNTIITHPLDLIKVRLQLSSAQSRRPFDSLREVTSGIAHDARVAKTSGNLTNSFSVNVVRQLYRGAAPNLLGNISAWGLYFALYSEFKLHMPTTENTAKYFTASTMAGISTSVLTNPIWVLKTRMLSTLSQAANSYKSVADGIRQILRNEGILTFWTGTLPSLFSVFQASLQFTLYDHSKNYLVKRKSHNEGAESKTDKSDKAESGNHELRTAEYMYASVFSKSVSMTIWYPTQLIRSRLQSYNFEKEKRGIRSVVRKIYEREGVRGFYRGLSANVVRVLPSTIITFVTYETTKNYLSRV